MNKSELVERVARQCGITKKSAELTLSAAFDGIIETVSSGGEVKIAGFGAFKPVHREGRTGRNPKTGEEVTIAARIVPKFTPAPTFKNSVSA